MRRRSNPADPGQTEACCLLGHSASHLLLHNPKADNLVKNRQGLVSLGKWWGLGSYEPRELWQLTMITIWSILRAWCGFVANVRHAKQHIPLGLLSRSVHYVSLGVCLQVPLDAKLTKHFHQLANRDQQSQDIKQRKAVNPPNGEAGKNNVSGSF